MRFLALLLLLVTPALHGETVYRWVDADGNVQYSDRPMTSAAQPVTVRVTPPSNSPRPPRATPATSPTAPSDGGSGDNPNAAESEEDAAQAEAQRAENCEIARERLQRYVQSRRLYKALENGEREYLSDAEIDAARARAQADVESWCS